MWLRALIAAILGAIAIAVAALPAQGQAGDRSLTWRRFDVDLQILSDGSLAVAETQEIAFRGTYQRGSRVVPTDRTTGIADVSVAEIVNGQTVPYASGTGRPNTYSVSRVDGDVRVDWTFSPTTDASRTFVVRYVAHGAVRLYPDGDQLQWKAIFADRAADVTEGTATVHLPPGASTSGVASAFYHFREGDSPGALPEAGKGEVVQGGAVRFALGSLPAGVGAEVRVQFPHGAIATSPPPWQSEADRADWVQQTVAPIGRFLSLLFAIAILAGGGAALFLLWYGSGRDPGVGKVPPRIEEPPTSLPAPLVGTLVDEVADVQDAVAALVDLGQRGLVALADEQNPQLAGSPQDVRITLRAPIDDPRLRHYERTLLVALFGSDAQVDATIVLSTAKTRFAAAIPVLQEQLYRAVVDAGLFIRDPQGVRKRYQGLGLVLFGLGVLGAIAATMLLGDAIRRIWLPGAALAVVGLALTWLSRVMPRRTPQGALEAAQWRAFRAHLMDETRRPGPDGTVADVQQFLPYAVALGVDRTFLRTLEAVGTPPPVWYGRGPGGVVVMPGPWYGGPWVGPAPRGDGGQAPMGAPPGAPGAGGAGVPNPQGWSDALAGLLNAASEAMSHGGGSGGWSGGGFGGGGGGGGGSGGFN